MRATSRNANEAKEQRRAAGAKERTAGPDSFSPVELQGMNFRNVARPRREWRAKPLSSLDRPRGSKSRLFPPALPLSRPSSRSPRFASAPTTSTKTTSATTERTLPGERRQRERERDGGRVRWQANARRRKYWVYFEILFRCAGRAALLHAAHRFSSASTQLYASDGGYRSSIRSFRDAHPREPARRPRGDFDLRTDAIKRPAIPGMLGDRRLRDFLQQLPLI